MTQQNQSKNIHSTPNTPTLKKRKSVPNGTNKDHTKGIARSYIAQKYELLMNHKVIIQSKDNTKGNGDREIVFKVKGLGVVGTVKGGYLYVWDTPMKDFDGLLPKGAEESAILVRNIRSEESLWCKKCRQWKKMAKLSHCEKGHYLLKRPRFTSESIVEWDHDFLSLVNYKRQMKKEQLAEKNVNSKGKRFSLVCKWCNKKFKASLAKVSTCCPQHSKRLQKFNNAESIRKIREHQDALNTIQEKAKAEALENPPVTPFKPQIVQVLEGDEVVKYFVYEPASCSLAHKATISIDGKAWDEMEIRREVDKCGMTTYDSLGIRLEENFEVKTGEQYKMVKECKKKNSKPKDSITTHSGGKFGKDATVGKYFLKGGKHSSKRGHSKNLAHNTSIPKANEKDVKKNQSIADWHSKKTVQPKTGVKGKFRNSNKNRIVKNMEKTPDALGLFAFTVRYMGKNRIAKSTKKIPDEARQYGVPNKAIVSKTN